MNGLQKPGLSLFITEVLSLNAQIMKEVALHGHKKETNVATESHLLYLDFSSLADAHSQWVLLGN